MPALFLLSCVRKEKMKILSRIFIAFILTTTIFLPVMAEGYTALVIPNSSVVPKRINKVYNTDIEKLLARKIIDKMEKAGSDYAPTLDVIRISIINNSDFNKNSKEPMENVKTLSKAYGIAKVVLISSKTEIISANEQKEFWNKMNLPVLTQPEANIKVTTTIKLYNSKTDEIIYSDVFYKKLNVTGNDLNNEQRKLCALNEYYDELLPRLFDGMKESKETHAKIISTSDVPKIKTNEATPVLMYKPIIKEKTSEKTTITRKVKPDLAVKENVTAEKKEGFMTKFKGYFKHKYANKTKSSDKKVATKSEKTNVKPFVVKKNIIKKVSKENGFNTQTKSTKLTKTEKTAGKKISVGNSIKTKYSDIKSKYISNKLLKAKQSEENVKYSAVITPNEDNTSSANRYIQTRPRTNARNFSPHFSNEVNDI